MKNYKKLVGASIVLAIFGFVVWFLFIQSTAKRIITPTIAEMQTEGVTTTDSETKSNASDTEQSYLSLDELLENSPKIKKIFELGQAANKDISFYGKVLDQNGEPVSGVKVTYSIPTYETSINPAVKVKQTITDESGAFVIEGESGAHVLMRSLEKHGYSFDKMGGRVFHYSARTVADKPFQPDAANPVIFHAWKKGYAAKELKRGQAFITPEADSVRVLKFPETEETVSIRFIHRDPKKTEENRGQRRWTAYLVVERGGILETDDTFLYEAPESGYQTEWEVSGKEDEWIKKSFYLSALNGQVYARIDAEMTGYYGQGDDKGAIDITYTLNPTGSRNLLSEND